MRALLLALALGPVAPVAPASEPDAEPRYVTSRITVTGTILGRRVVDIGDDKTLDLVVAVSVRRPGGGHRRELRVHPFGGDGTVANEAAITIPVMDDVIAYGFGDVRSEDGPELLFLTSSGAYSYSLLKDGYRDNIARLAETDLLFDVADPESLPEWRYVLRDRAGADGVLLPERGGFSLWSGPRDAPFDLVSRIGKDETDADFIVENSVRVRGGSRNLDIRFNDGNVFLTDFQGALASLMSSRSDVRAPALVDVDGDGRTDLLQRHKDELWVHLDDGTGIPAQPTRIEIKPEYLDRDNADLDRLLHDIDQDGDIDMLAQLDDDREGLDAGVTRLLVLVNDGSRLYPEQPDQVLRFEGTAVRAEVQDVDGDGRADLVITKYEAPSLAELATNFQLRRSVFLYLGRGDRPFEKKPALRNEQTFNIETVQEAVVRRHLKTDFSGDGIADLVEVDTSGRVAIRRVTRSSGFFGGEDWELDRSPWKRFDLQGELENLEVADVNGDGLGDLVTHSDHTLSLAFSRRAP